MQKRIERAWRSNPVFFNAAPDTLSRVVANSRCISLDAGQKLYEESDPARSVFVVESGLLRVYRRLEASELTITHVRAPSTVGEMEVIAEGAGACRRGYLANIIALKPADLVGCQADVFLDALEKTPSGQRHVMREICIRGADASTREIGPFFPLRIRLAALLVEYVELVGLPCGDDAIRIDLRLTRRDLADSLGVTVRSIARVLREWKNDDLVSRNGGWIVIHDSKRLEALCEGHRFKLGFRYEADA